MASAAALPRRKGPLDGIRVLVLKDAGYGADEIAALIGHKIVGKD